LSYFKRKKIEWCAPYGACGQLSYIWFGGCIYLFISVRTYFGGENLAQSLVDDDLVNQDKIGISNFFWSFPSEAAVKLNNEQQKLESKLSSLEKEETVLKEKVEKAKVGKEDSKERQDLDKRIHVLSDNIAEKKRELEEFAENDPERFEKLSTFLWID
jgi:hypothetical protein